MLGAIAALAMAACSGVQVSPTQPAPTVPATQPPASPSAPRSAAAPTLQLVSSPTIGPYGLALQPGLLSVLPSALGDLPVAESPDVEAPVLQDRELPKHAAGYAGAVVGDLGGTDWATVSVVQLKPGSATEAYYATWRADYDKAACDQAGGVETHERITRAGQQVDHDTCSGGVDIYHVFLASRALLISVTSIGEQRLGDQLVSSLHV